MTAALTANSAIPAGLRRKPALDSADLADVKGHAAGILFVAPDGDVLLLRRSSTEENYAGHWALPGGKMDDGESPEDGADRETVEEIGFKPVGDKKLLDQRVTPNKMVFHTFAQPSMTKFVPELNAEHSGFAWAPISQLPQPLHPAVAQTIKDRLGDDFTADGFAEWAKAPDPSREEKIDARLQRLAERRAGQAADGKIVIDVDDEDGQLEKLLLYLKQNSETGHSFDVVVDPDDSELARKFYIDGDGAFRMREITAADSALVLALDRDTVREKTRDGRLCVKIANISKANVCPYRGKEIPGFADLGLEPDKIYNLLRDPEELKKAAPTLNGVQLLRKHIPVNATDHQPYDTVGSLGTDAEFDGTYLRNSIFVNAQDAIDGIESGKKRELSAGYHYKPDMTPGKFDGKAFDGIMRDIVFNHVALVEDGRAGPDVVVGDSMENVMAKPIRFASVVLAATAAHIAPLLAMDSKASLPKGLFKDLTPKTFTADKVKLLAGVRGAIDGKLRKGLALDASMEGLAKAIDAFEGLEKEVEGDPMDSAVEVSPIEAIEPEKKLDIGGTYDAEPMKAFLREKGMGEDDIMKACDMMPKPALDSDETPEEKAAREKKEADEKTAKDAEMKDMVSKPAMDAALEAQGKKFASDLKTVRDNERGVRMALAEVKPWVGDLPPTLAFDSAADVRRHALDMLKVPDAKTLHADALLPILNSIPKPGAARPQIEAPIAMDASTIDKAIKLAPGLANIQQV